MATMTGSVVLLLFTAHIVTRYGLGNGIAVIAVSSIIPHTLLAASQIFLWGKYGRLGVLLYLVLPVIFIGFVYIVFLITKKAKTIELQGQGHNKVFLHFRPTIVGLAPIVLGQSLAFFPVTPSSIINTAWAQNLTPTPAPTLRSGLGRSSDLRRSVGTIQERSPVIYHGESSLSSV